MLLSNVALNKLLELYYAQTLSTDSLGGSQQLADICLKFKAATGLSVTESEMLAEFIRLRKGGVIKARENKQPKEPPKPTWPKADGGVFIVPVPLRIGRLVMLSIMEHYFDTVGSLPVTRQEVFDWLMKNPQCFMYDGAFADNTIVLARLEQLFPEL